jgi:hypothetical protein
VSRSGYSDDCDNWDLIRWRGAVASAIRGRRGQAFLREMLAAMDTLPAPRLIEGALELGGDVCALGSIGRARGVDMSSGIDLYDREAAANLFGISEAMAAEIAFVNDEQAIRPETPEQRFRRVREWIVSKLHEAKP